MALTASEFVDHMTEIADKVDCAEALFTNLWEQIENLQEHPWERYRDVYFAVLDYLHYVREDVWQRAEEAEKALLRKNRVDPS